MRLVNTESIMVGQVFQRPGIDPVRIKSMLVVCHSAKSALVQDRVTKLADVRQFNFCLSGMVLLTLKCIKFLL